MLKELKKLKLFSLQKWLLQRLESIPYPKLDFSFFRSFQENFSSVVDVKLVGSKTYGKPVGYFGIGIDVYSAYLSSFRIFNAANKGDYFDGIPVDIATIDDVTKDFGDPSEDCMLKALGNTGECASSRNNNIVNIPVRNTGIRATPAYTAGGQLFSNMKENKLKLR